MFSPRRDNSQLRAYALHLTCSASLIHSIGQILRSVSFLGILCVMRGSLTLMQLA